MSYKTKIEFDLVSALKHCLVYEIYVVGELDREKPGKKP